MEAVESISDIFSDSQSIFSPLKRINVICPKLPNMEELEQKLKAMNIPKTYDSHIIMDLLKKYDNKLIKNSVDFTLDIVIKQYENKHVNTFNLSPLPIKSY